MSITSDEINYLIFRYLQESGFSHSAFTFGYESLVTNFNVNPNLVPPGALISYLQKGLQYKEIETHVGETGQEVQCEEPFTLLQPHTCKVAKKVPEPTIQTRRSSAMDYLEVSDNKVTVLQGHSSEVFICAWSPTNPHLLASGSGDSTARIWNVPDGPSGITGYPEPVELKHFTNERTQEKSKDITTLDWHPDGGILATGSYDGIARLWNEKGELKMSLQGHKGPIFSLKWNKRGDYLLSGSVDRTAIIWNAKSGQPMQTFDFHSAPTLDVDWRDDQSFATCSTDKQIHVCEYQKNKPLKSFVGHTDEVNAIEWDPTGTYLASCSDDYTAKVWSMKQDRPIYDFRQHTKEIYTIRWSPTGPGTANPNRNLVLASASFDASIKLWDIAVGKEIYSLTKHTDPVYSVAFSPNGEFLASGSFDRCLHIWSVKDGSLVRSYKGNGGIFEVTWNTKGDKVAACFSNNTVVVMDFP